MTIRALASVLVVALIVLSGCERSPPDDSGTTLRRGNGGEPQTLDPAIADDVHALNVLADLYEGLVAQGADGSLVPGAAESWEISADGRRYTFRLRDGLRWSNGESLTAEHFVAGIRRVARPGTISPYAFLLEPIRNFGGVTEGRVLPAQLGVRAADAGTVEFELETPAPHFLAVLAMPIASPSWPRGDARRFNDPQQFVGNGAYVLEEWTPGANITLRKNAHYRDADDVRIERIAYYPIVDPNSELNMYRAGELDLTATVPPAAIDDLRSRRAGELHIAPVLALYYIAFDLSEAPFDDVALRQALSMAIDREALTALLGRGEAPAYGLVPPGVQDHEPARLAWQDWTAGRRIAEARRHLADAGFDASNPLSIKYTYDTGDVHERVALAISSMWRDVLGIEVELEKKEWKYFLATRDDRPAWEVMRFAWTGDYNDASTFTDIFRSDNPQNLPGFHSEEYDALLDEARAAADPVERMARMQDAEATLINSYPIAPLYFYVGKHLVSSRVAGFRPNVLDRYPSRHLGLH